VYAAGAALPALLVLRAQPPSARLGGGRVLLSAKTALLPPPLHCPALALALALP
jgi:hypothetical protein